MVGKNITLIQKIWRLNEKYFGEMFNKTRGQISSYKLDRAKPDVEFMLELSAKTGHRVITLWTMELKAEDIPRQPLAEERKLKPYPEPEEVLISGHGVQEVKENYMLSMVYLLNKLERLEERIYKLEEKIDAT